MKLINFFLVIKLTMKKEKIFLKTALYGLDTELKPGPEP
jgi:hypothetical protein